MKISGCISPGSVGGMSWVKMHARSIMTLEALMKSARLPILSINNPRNGLAPAEIMYGVVYHKAASPSVKPNLVVSIVVELLM